MKTLTNIIYPAFTAFALVCFALSPTARAVDPPPDGGYPGGNTAEGQNALLSLDTAHGFYNTAVGIYSLLSLTIGDYNTAIGAGALFSNTTTSENTATGAGALFSNTIGGGNTANGSFALFSNINGSNNTAVGYHALLGNTTGNQNTAIGVLALAASNIGTANTAVGFEALFSNTDTGVGNSAFGWGALASNLSGQNNTAIGSGALGGGTAGNGNTAVGQAAGVNATGSGNIYIGAGVAGVAGEQFHTYIGNIATTPVTANPDFVTVDLTTGLLAHNSSSHRYKEDIHVMKEASEVLYRLKPVTYRFKKEIDPGQKLQYGLVAEDVAQVDPNLALRNGKGDIEDVRYMAVSAMLLNEFLKEHHTVQEQEARLTRQEALIAQQQKQIEALTAGLQKVSAQLEGSKPAPRVVNNNQ